MTAANTGKRLSNAVVLEFMGDIPVTMIESLREIMTRRQVRDHSFPKLFQLIMIIDAEQIFSLDLKPLTEFAFYHLEIRHDLLPNFTGHLVRRSPIIQPKQLEKLFNSGRAVHVSSEMETYIKDIISCLRNDRRLCLGISARVSRGFSLACR